MESYNMTEDKINQIMNAAAEEIAKYVDVCNEGGQLVMKVKDGVTSKGDTFNGIHYGSVKSDKDFLNPFGLTVNEIYIDTTPDKVVIGCTIPTSIKLSKRCKDHSAFCVLRDNPKAAVVCGKRGEDVPCSYQQFCNVVQEKINTNTNGTNMDGKSINEVFNYINENDNNKTKGNDNNKTQGKKKRRKKKSKKQKTEDQKAVDKTEDQNVEEIQMITKNTAPQENLINITDVQVNQIIEEQPQIEGQPQQIEQQNTIEQSLNNDVQQNAGTRNHPNYIVRPGHNQTRPFYKNGHCLQMAKIYFTNSGQMNQEQIHQHAGPVGQTPLPVPPPANSRKGYYTQLGQQNQTRLSLNAKPFRPKGK